METLENMNEALSYIEDNLTEEIDIKQAATLAYCSEYHFKRMFSFLAGVTLAEYIRRRRLTLAAIDLNSGSMRVIDIALKYGYSSPDSFTRAFQILHGVTPSEARKKGQSLKAYPKMTFQLTIKGGEEMNYRIEEKEAFRIIGLKKRVPLHFHGVNPEIAAMWNRLDHTMIEELKMLSNVAPAGFLSASTNFPREGWREEASLIII